MKPLLTMLLGLLLTPLLWAVESQQANFRVEVIARNLDHPWGLAFLDSGQLLVTERSGQLRLVKQGRVGKPIAGLPEIWVGGQGGLLDVTVQGDWIYFSYAEPGTLPLTNSTAVARAKLSPPPPLNIMWG